MPAGITETDGMAYVGQKPWHNLGVKVEGSAMTAQQAIEAADMDWKVELHPIYSEVADIYGNVVHPQIEDKNAVVRMDTKEVLGVVGNKYQPVQNIECFDLFDAVVGTGEAKYNTVGTLNGGKRVWLLAKFDNTITLDNGEEIESYMLLSNSHDGGSSLTMQWCDIRVVCQNTFSMAMNSKNDLKRGLQRFKARHTSGIILKANEARQILMLQSEYQKILEEEINLLAQREWDMHDMKRLSYKLTNYDLSKPVEKFSGTPRENATKLTELFRFGTGNKGETAWDAYNAVTEFVSHYKGYGRSINSIGAVDEKTVNARMTNNWFGDGVNMRDLTWSILTADEDEKEEILSPYNLVV